MSIKRSPFGPFAVLAMLTAVVMVLTNNAKADEPCKSPEALEHLANAKKNQTVLAEHRPARDRVVESVGSSDNLTPEDVEGYNTFVLFKGYNESESEALHKLGCGINWKTLELEPLDTETVVQAVGYDLDKLAKAVAMHETKDCGVDVGSALVNNCFGIRKWDANGKPYFKKYATKEDSYKDFKRIWTSYYGRFPDWSLAKKYSGNDRPESWLANVTHYYNTL